MGKIKDYFLIFGNPEPYDNPNYWERDYIVLGQVILGILFSPFFVIGWIITKIGGIKIKP